VVLIQDFTHLVRDRGRRERLLEKCDGHRRPAGLDPLGEIATAHVRHDHVREEQVDRSRVLGGDPDGFLTIGGLQ